MSSDRLAVTTATGMGPLPQLLQQVAGAGAVARTFRRTGLPTALIDERQLQLPLRSMVDLFAEAGRASGDPLFGLRVGLGMEPQAYGLWADYSLAAPTLGLALRRLAWSIPLHQRGPALRLEARSGLMVLSYRMPDLRVADSSHHSDHVVPVMLRVLRLYLGRHWLPKWIEVDYPSDGRGPDREALVDRPWRFAGNCVSMPIPVQALAARREETQAPAIERLTAIDVVAARRRDSPLASAIEVCIGLELLEGRANVDGAAKRLGMSVRTLQRRLSGEGLSFRELATRVRMRRARELLCRPDATIVQTALASGYSDPANFSRAFRREFGRSPTAHRIRSLDDPSSGGPLRAPGARQRKTADP